MNNDRYYVYILLCNNNTYYTGYTNNLEKRFQSHVDGTGKCKYTRSFKPVKIAQSWIVERDKAKAMHLERTIKKLSRIEKEKIIENPMRLTEMFGYTNISTLLTEESSDEAPYLLSPSLRASRSNPGI